MTKLKKVSAELANEILKNNGIGIDTYGCGCGSGSGSGSGSGCGCGCGDNWGGIETGSDFFRLQNPRPGVWLDASVMGNAKLTDQLYGLFTESDTLNQILRPCDFGANITVKVGDTGDPNTRMLTHWDKDSDMEVSVTISSLDVDKEKGYTFSHDGTSDSGEGYKYNGTKQGTFAGIFTHEALHANHIFNYRSTLNSCNGDAEKARNYMVISGQGDLANVFFKEDAQGNWIERGRNEWEREDHKLIHSDPNTITLIEKVVSEYGKDTNW